MLKKTVYRKYFAAANTYNGFKSYFNKVFDPNELEIIYILKGGPGTGKSTLMRNIASVYNEKIDSLDYIYCSSDTNSLDGIILQNNDKRVAIIDGTAPHMTDPIYPGAVDRIINLGEAFNIQNLIEKRKDIILLNKEKGEAYKKAYFALKHAGDVESDIYTIFDENDIYNKAELHFEEVLKTIFAGYEEGYITQVLLSAYGKDGHQILSPYFGFSKSISVFGDGMSEYILTRIISNRIVSQNYKAILGSSALTERNIDIISINDICVSVSSSNSINSVDTTYITAKLPDKYRMLKQRYNDTLKIASDYFLQASLKHFELEDIYKQNMNFDLNKEVQLSISSEIENMLL